MIVKTPCRQKLHSICNWVLRLPERSSCKRIAMMIKTQYLSRVEVRGSIMENCGVSEPLLLNKCLWVAVEKVWREHSRCASQESHMKVPKQRRCLRSGRKADTAQMWLGWKQFTTEPTFNPQASMEQDLAVKQGRCLPVQRPKGGDMERASWVHVETLCSGLLNLHSKLLQGTILHCRHHMKTEFPILFCK